MQRTSLVNFNGKSRPVKNLGWLLKHWKDVDYIRITKLKGGRCWFRAFMKNPTRDKVFYYFTVWESTANCIEWLHRPVFEGLPLVIQRFRYETQESIIESIQTC